MRRPRVTHRRAIRAAGDIMCASSLFERANNRSISEIKHNGCRAREKEKKKEKREGSCPLCGRVRAFQLPF